MTRDSKGRFVKGSSANPSGRPKKVKLDELQDRLNEIFEGIDDYYSQSILDKLVGRIDETISDFNKEFQSLVGDLNKKPIKKSKPVRATRKKPRTTRKAKTVVSRSKPKPAASKKTTKSAVSRIKKKPVVSKSKTKHCWRVCFNE